MKKFILFISAILCFLSSANAALDPDTPLKFDENVVRGELANGVKFYILKNDIPKKSALFYLDVAAGSADENDDEQGLAHFVEHMAFNGSEHFDKNELVHTLERLGVKFGADLNAQTSFENTTYNIQAQVSDETLRDVFLVLRDYAGGVKFDENETQKEKGVILEEAKKDFERRFYEKRAAYLYPNSVFSRRFPIGKNEIISSATGEQLRKFYERNYLPSAISVIVVGDVDVAQIKTLIEQHFSSLEPRGERIERDLGLQPFKAGFANTYETELGANVASVLYADAYKPLTTVGALKDAWLQAYVAKLMGLGYDAMNVNSKTPLKAYFGSDDLFKRRKLYSLSANIFNFDTNATLSSLFSTIKGVREHGFSDDDFKSVKAEFINELEADLLKNDTQSSQVGAILDYVQNGNFKLSKQDEHDLSLEILNEITLKDVNEFFMRITDGARFSELISTKNLGLSEADENKLYESAAPFDFSGASLGKKELAGADLKPKKFSTKKGGSGIEILTFANGAKVYLRPLKSEKNRVKIAATRRGGYARLGRARGDILTALLNSGTIGSLNEYEAKRLTSRFDYRLGFRMDDASSGFRGSSASGDLEAMVRELYARFSEPLIHENAFFKYKTDALSAIALRDETAQFKFREQILKSLYAEGLSQKLPVSASDVHGAVLNELQRDADEIFSGAGDFIFVLSGDFDAKLAKQALAKYVGNLKSSKEGVAPKIQALKTRSVRLEQDYGDSDKSEVDMIFLNHELEGFDFLNTYKFQALKSVLSTRIVEQIREARGQIYSALVRSSYVQFPHITASLNVSFSCEPKNTDAIIAGVNEILKQIESSGAKDVELSNFKKAQILSIKRAAQTNDFWLGNITANALYGYPLYDEKGYAARVNAVKSVDVQKAAQMLSSRLFTAILNPKPSSDAKPQEAQPKE